MRRDLNSLAMKVALVLFTLAIACGGGNNGPDAAAGSLQPADACQRYLSCVLAVAPESYAAQLMLYGQSSECWKTPQQTTNCGIACDAAFHQIESQCTCVGTSCQSSGMGSGSG